MARQKITYLGSVTSERDSIRILEGLYEYIGGDVLIKISKRTQEQVVSYEFESDFGRLAQGQVEMARAYIVGYCQALKDNGVA